MSAAGQIHFDGTEDVRLSGSLSFDTVTGLFEKMAAHLQTGAAPTRLDLSGVSTADSAGLALLLEWQAVMCSTGSSVQIANAPSSLLRLAQLCDAVGLLNLSGRHE